MGGRASDIMVDLAASHKKKIRIKTLEKVFKVKHNGRPPQDKYEEYILKAVQHLGEVYDENHRELSFLTELTDPKRQFHQKREEILNRLGHDLRVAINIDIKDTDIDKSMTKYRKTVIDAIDGEDIDA